MNFNKIFSKIYQDNNFRLLFNFNELTEIDDRVIASVNNTQISSIHWIYNAFTDNYGQIGCHNDVLFALDYDLNLKQMSFPLQDFPLALMKDKYTIESYKNIVKSNDSFEHYIALKEYLKWCQENNIKYNSEYLLYL